MGTQVGLGDLGAPNTKPPNPNPNTTTHGSLLLKLIPLCWAKGNPQGPRAPQTQGRPMGTQMALGEPGALNLFSSKELKIKLLPAPAPISTQPQNVNLSSLLCFDSFKM